MTGLLHALVFAAALDGTHLVVALPIVTSVDGAKEPAELRWLIRRDENERGVVPHQPGWMDYGKTPWLNHHLAVVTRRGGAPAVRWMSSALELDGLFVEGGDVVLRSKGALTRYVFRGWQLERSARPPDPRLNAERLAAVFDTGLVHLAVVGDVMLGRATAKALDVIGAERAFEQARPVLARADVRLGNLESCFHQEAGGAPRPRLRAGPRDAGAGGRPGLRGADVWALDAHPQLGLVAPLRHAPALRLLGFDALSLANNHCDDQDAAFSQQVLAGLGVSGVRDEPVMLKTPGGVVAMVALLAWPERRETLDALLSPSLARRLDAARARAQHVVALVHFGEEYAPLPTASQRRVAAWLLEHGVTAVLGAHPHVQQPIEQPTPGSLVAWSLGNFVFDQEGYPTGAGAKTEESVVLEVRLHRALGLTWRTTPFRIVGRARLVRP